MCCECLSGMHILPAAHANKVCFPAEPCFSSLAKWKLQCPQCQESADPFLVAVQTSAQHNLTFVPANEAVMGLPKQDVSQPPPFLHQHHIDSVVTASSGGPCSASALSMDLEVMQSENAQQSSQSQGDYLHYIDYSDSGSEYETQSVHPADDDSESDHNESYQGMCKVN